uniref:RING-CH-type domain-containing protein n=1 Tax=Parastrongyloides trichosuri TaxID=131310 RepID=A0A0N4Z0X5_PARTI
MDALGGFPNIDVLQQNEIELFLLPSCYSSSTTVGNDKNNYENNINENTNDSTIVCRFCLSGDEMKNELGEWIAPCKCSGSMKFVHRECFSTWMSYASNNQRYQCRTCSFAYIRMWKMKSPCNWTLPKLNLTYFDIFTIIIDFYATKYLYNGFCHVIEGKKSLVIQGLGAFFYRKFVLSRTRIGFYISILRNMCLTIFSEEFADAKCSDN